MPSCASSRRQSSYPARSGASAHSQTPSPEPLHTNCSLAPYRPFARSWCLPQTGSRVPPDRAACLPALCRENVPFLSLGHHTGDPTGQQDLEDHGVWSVWRKLGAEESIASDTRQQLHKSLLDGLEDLRL